MTFKQAIAILLTRGAFPENAMLDGFSSDEALRHRRLHAEARVKVENIAADAMGLSPEPRATVWDIPDVPMVIYADPPPRAGIWNTPKDKET